MAAHGRSVLSDTGLTVPVGADACCWVPGRGSSCGSTGRAAMPGGWW
jgi:hypothetical protein